MRKFTVNQSGITRDELLTLIDKYYAMDENNELRQSLYETIRYYDGWECEDSWIETECDY